MSDSVSTPTAILLVFAFVGLKILLIVLTWRAAGRKNRDTTRWTMAAIFFSLPSFLIILALPPKPKSFLRPL
jgi:hypothetical protein